MNKKQKRRIVVGALAMVFIGLIPPWTYTLDLASIHRTKPAGYEFIFDPPSPEKNAPAYGVEMDVKRLFVQWIIVLIFTGVGFLLATKQTGVQKK